MSNTPVLDLPEIAEGVASQTVLHNQALRLIEARLVRVFSRTTTAPPGSPAEGDSYIIPAGTWGGSVDQVASWIGGGWSYYTPVEGVSVWVNDDDEQVVYDGAAWTASGGGGGASITVADTLPTLAQGEQWFESDSGGLFMRYVNPDATETLIAMYPAGGDSASTIPQNSQSAAYTTVAADAGKHLLHPSADTTARTFTIAANASVAYPIGTAITFVNQASAGVMTIAITADTMRLAGAGTTGSRTLAANGIATALKITATEWIISGSSGLT